MPRFNLVLIFFQLLAQSFNAIHADMALPTMKQILLLIAVYSLIINQSSKSSKSKKQTFTPVHEKTDFPVKPTHAKPPAQDIATPAFSYTTFRLTASYPLFYSELK